MLLKQIVAVGACIFALMLVVKDGRVPRLAGLTGSCAVVQSYPDSSAMVSCRAGRLDGKPNLAHRGCTSAETTRTVEYWRCLAGYRLHGVTR